MKKYLYKYPGLYAAYILALFINQVVVVSVALFLQYVMDSVAALSSEKIITAALIGFGYIVVLFIVEQIRRRIAAHYMYKTIYKLKMDVFTGILGKTSADLNRINSAQYISIMNNDIGVVETNYFTAYFAVVQSAIAMVIAIGVLVWLNPFVALITIILSLVPLSVPKLSGKRLADSQGLYVQFLGKFNEKVKDFLEGFEVIKTFGAERNVKLSFSEAAKNTEMKKYQFNKTNANVNAFANMLSVGVQFAIFLVSGWFVLRGDLTVGAIVAITQLSGNVIAPIMQITQQSSLMKSAKLVNARICDVMSLDDSRNKKITLTQMKDSLVVKNLTFSYDGSKKAVSNLDYAFKKGGKYAIVGGSGSGKSTLLRLIMGYYDNYNGEVCVDKNEVRDISQESLCKTISMMHQNVFLFDDTFRNNITLFEQYSEPEYKNAITKAGLADVESSLVDGALTKVGEGGKTLSGGERQRIAIARAVIRGCEVLILDEATANLDNETAYNIEWSLMEASDLTCIFVTHRYNQELLRKYDGILVMRGGELVESGGFDELYDNQGYFYSLYNVGGGE